MRVEELFEKRTLVVDRFERVVRFLRGSALFRIVCAGRKTQLIDQSGVGMILVVDQVGSRFDVIQESLQSPFRARVLCQALRTAVHLLQIVSDAYAVLVGLHIHIAFIVLPDVFLDHLVEGFVYVYVTRKHDIVLIVLQDLEKLEKPVFHGGIGDPGVPGSGTEGDIAEQVEEIFDPFADRDPVVLKQRSGKDCEGSSAVSAPVSLYAVGREAVLFEIDRSAVSAALWRKAVDQICFVGAFQFGMSVVVGIKIV